MASVIHSILDTPKGNIRAYLKKVGHDEELGMEAFYEPDINKWVKPSGEILKTEDIAHMNWVEA